jgi:hypothetical protein
MLLPISFNAKSTAQKPVLAGPVSLDASVQYSQDRDSQNRSIGKEHVAKSDEVGGFQWVSFGSAKKPPSEGELATQEFEGAKDQLRAALEKTGKKLDDANFLILSSGKKLYGIVPECYSNQAIKDFENALVEALKALPADAFPRLAKFATEEPPAVLIERVKYYRPC